MNAKTYLLMAGGTGGHVYPALATAKALQHSGDSVVWMGSSNGMEQAIVRAEGIPFNGLSIKGLRGKGALSFVLAPFRLLYSLIQALNVMRKVKPDCVLGMGGFASGPGGVAARLFGKPLVIHEQNSVAGMTNRWLSRIANQVLEAFPHSFPAEVDAQLTGNPLRADIAQMYYEAKPLVEAGKTVKILVLGGSLGAVRLNESVPLAISSLEESIRPEVWHQTGKHKYAETEACYQREGVTARVTEFIDEMDEAYRWADFVICRAGALTISELCAVGLGAILVPYPYAVDDHQTLNAVTMESAGAAWILPQLDLDPGTLAGILAPLLQKPERIQKLSNAAKKLGKPDATELVATACRRLCNA
jgi:UDP-N-acetylglucosamine--N-acetylmuramyl-(pentapeptide) pyrophosphoryl-undecaprenol N-acetylglucosamine transferase